MNAEIKRQLDEGLIEGALTPEEYLAEVRAHCERAADPDVPGKSHTPKRLKRGLKPWQWRVLIPVSLFFSATLAEPVASPTVNVAPSGGQPAVTGRDQLVVTPDTKPKTLREYYEPAAQQPDIFSMPDPQTMASGSYPRQAGPPQISLEDAYALGLVLSPFVQLQQEMLAQQQDAARQKYQAQQLKEQQDVQRRIEYAQRFQNMGMPHWARPQQKQQQQSFYTFTCPKCGLTQQFAQFQFQGVRCPRDGTGMWKK